MCNTSECIAETLCVENDLKWTSEPTIGKLWSSNEGITKKVKNGVCLTKRSSFKQVCEFPMTLCRRGSKDILLWLNGLTLSNKKSPLEILKHYYNQIQSSLFLILMCGVLVMISVEACVCLFLLSSFVLENLEPGFLFLLSTFAGVGFIGLRILTSKKMNKTKKKIKSKEI